MLLVDPTTNQSVDFVLPNTKKIGINCSGGADSSILLLLLFHYCIQNNIDDMKIIVVTSVNDNTGRTNGKHANAVINYIIEKTNKNFIDQHIMFYRKKQMSAYFYDIIFPLLETKKVDFFMTGRTCNPLENTFVENCNNEIVNLSNNALPIRNGTNHPVYEKNGKNETVWYRPFINVDKRFIRFLYNYLGANDLFYLTRSCEPFSLGQKTFVYQKEVENHCGKCWWCLERKWAFGRL